MRRVAIYAREDETASAQAHLDTQIAAVATFVGRHRWWHVATYVNVCSAATLDRPGLAQLIVAAHATWFDLVVVERRETVALDPIACHQVRDELAVAGVSTVVMRPPLAARLGRVVAGLALVDLVDER